MTVAMVTKIFIYLKKSTKKSSKFTDGQWFAITIIQTNKIRGDLSSLADNNLLAQFTKET